MENLRLTVRSKKSITRKVWGLWVGRKAAPLAALAVIAGIESAFVSLGDVVANAAGATQNLGSLSDFLFAAVVNAELYVLAGAAIILVGGVVFVKSIVRDLRLMPNLNR